MKQILLLSFLFTCLILGCKPEMQEGEKIAVPTGSASSTTGAISSPSPSPHPGLGSGSGSGLESEGTSEGTELMYSTLPRDGNTDQIVLSEEMNTISDSPRSTNYREIPSLNDDDGLANPTVVKMHPVPTLTPTPLAECGSESGMVIKDRISDCHTTWLAKEYGIGGEADWQLVTRIGYEEVWKDTRTGLLWSDNIVPTPSTSPSPSTWAEASGNSLGGNRTSLCAEFDPSRPTVSLQGGLGDNYSGGTYSTAKGGMGKGARYTQVFWRLPTKADYYQADIDGIRFVIPNFNDPGNPGTGSRKVYWTATTATANNHGAAFGYYSNMGNATVGPDSYISTAHNNVRCVGRY